MRKIYVIFVVVALGIATTFSGCKKEVKTSDLVLDDFETGKLTCFVGAVFDGTIGKEEAVPNGTKVIISAKNSDFNIYATGNVTKEVELTSGSAEVELKVPSTGVKYTVTVVGFKHNYKDGTGTRKYFWEGKSTPILVIPNSNNLAQITCTGNLLSF